jgi:hypothetical protein
VFSHHQHLKSSSPQSPWEDIETISAVFAGWVISEGFGKLSTIFALRLATKQAGPWLTLPRFVAKRKCSLVLLEPPQSYQAHEAGAQEQRAGRDGGGCIARCITAVWGCYSLILIFNEGHIPCSRKYLMRGTKSLIRYVHWLNYF